MERFPSKAVEVVPVSFDTELADLRRQPEEALSSYYKRTTSLMQRVGARDRSQGEQPSLLESAMLTRSFVLGSEACLTSRSVKNPPEVWPLSTGLYETCTI